MTTDSEFDFYLSANCENAFAQEVARTLRDAGYLVYLPGRKDEVARKRLAASKSRAFVLLLVNDIEQNQFLADILTFAPTSIEEGRVVVIQCEDCELAGLIDPSLISTLTGLTDAGARKVRIIEAVELPDPTGAVAETGLAEVRAHFGEESKPQPELDTIPHPKTPGPASLPPDIKVEESNTPNVDVLGTCKASSAPNASSHQSESVSPQEHPTIQDRAPPIADPHKGRLTPSRPPAVSDQAAARPIYETGIPAIDDPVAALVDIISDNGAPAHTTSTSRPPGWLSKELAAARGALPSVTGKDRQDKRDTRLTPGNKIPEFAVSHPTQFSMGVPFVIDALVYRQEDRRLAVLRAAELSTAARRFDSSVSATPASSIKLSVTIRLPWPTEPTSQIINWHGELSFASFRVVPPKYATSRTVRGACEFSVDGLTVGEVQFPLQLGNSNNPNDRQIARAPAAKSAFACYAKRDRRRVLSLTQGIEQLGVSVFTDMNGIRGNQKFESEIFNVIARSDFFYLFWSRHAAGSNWIEQEWRYGMKSKGVGFIHTVPLDDPRKVSPPIELADKLLHDWAITNSGRYLSVLEKVGSWLF
jgi:TIR domain